MSGPIVGPDGLARCPWGLAAADYVAYHDDEWGRPLRGDDRIFERLTLEAFQSGLSWLTILRKREAFRRAFAGFSIAAVAGFGADDVERLMADAGIVRNRAKIEAAVTNARAAAGLPDGLSVLAWSFQPTGARPAPVTLDDVPSTSPESVALAKELKRHGFAFVGPTTAYALMQAVGMVNDHLVGCHARGYGIELFGESSGSRPIELVPPDPEWPRRFARVRDLIAGALGDTAVRVDHVGSTSVPDLPAKPILDVQVSVPDVEDEAAYLPTLGGLGWALRAREPGHRFLREPDRHGLDVAAGQAVHVHVCESGSPWERDHLLFAAYLRAHADRRDAYAALKDDLAVRYRTSRLAYTERKSRFVRHTLEQAERWAARTGWRP